MGGKNAYLEKQRALNQQYLDVGEEMGIQKIWDYLQIALRDPEIMGKDIFGRNRLMKLHKKLGELADYYANAFTSKVDADNKQEELDGVLKEIWGDDIQTFYERYPYIKKLGYDKPQKGWVD